VVIRVTGAENMRTFGERLTQWYVRKNPAVQFTVSTSRASEAFVALASGGAEIVQSSRLPTRSEDELLRSGVGKKYLKLQVATEIGGIAVNSSNPVEELSLFQLRQVLSGEVKNWKKLGGQDAPIVIYGRDDDCDVRSFLEEEFMGDVGISSSTKLFPTNSALFAALAQDPNGIGFGTVESVSNGKVRFLAVKTSEAAIAIPPTGDTIRAKQYKLIRPLYFCFAGTPDGDMNRFAQWVLSTEGQLVVEAVGYYPLSSVERAAGLQQLSTK
jgi:phosphate transport system substrate-binding protein